MFIWEAYPALFSRALPRIRWLARCGRGDVMADGYATLGGQDGAPRPDGWYTDRHGTAWAYFGVYVTREGRMAHSLLVSRYTVGVVFSEAITMGPKQPRRFARFDTRSRWWLEDRAEWFARSEPFSHPGRLIAAADAAGVPFKRPKVHAG